MMFVFVLLLNEPIREPACQFVVTLLCLNWKELAAYGYSVKSFLFSFLGLYTSYKVFITQNVVDINIFPQNIPAHLLFNNHELLLLNVAYLK